MSEKVIFISHSSRDYGTAKRFCDTFEACGLGCWIAPRDIPYGAEWAEAIVRGIRASSILLVLITKHSVVSKHVIREINAAVQNDIQVLYVKLGAAPLSDGLVYYLDVLQKIDLDLSSNRCDEALLQLAGRIKSYLSARSGQKGERILREPGGARNPFTIEDELSKLHEEIFSEENLAYGRTYVRECSPFRKKLMERLCGKILGEITGLSDGGRTGADKEEAAGGKGPVSGFHFTVEESEGFIMAFVIKRRISAKTHRYGRYPERMKYSVEDMGGRRKKITFFFCDEAYLSGEYTGMELVLIKFLEERDTILLFEGFWHRGDMTVKISDRPHIMPFYPPAAETAEKLLRPIEDLGSLRIHPLTAALYGQPSCDGKFRWRSDDREESFLIVDLTAEEVVYAVTHYTPRDRREEEILELEGGHYYLTMRCGGTRDATDHEIGRALFTGAEGLERNWLKAAEYFDRAGSPEAAFFLGRIFSEDPLLADAEDAGYYFQRACAGGVGEASYYLQKSL
ncbi:MAG: toll/interleukin-1 receptor domain-containing protein [Lachnospiraceae bacterium]|nr:toll/interleukin-1 receptor domain-containing protein [Lachnospiraceae bacterium]